MIDPEEIRHNLWWKGCKYETLAIISMVVFATLAVGALWCACVYAVESVPLVVLGVGFLLQTTHANFFHPWRLKAQEYWDKVALEERVIAKISTMQEAGEDQGDITTIVARQRVYEDLAQETLGKIRDIFAQPSNLSAPAAEGDYNIYNYQALLEWSLRPNLRTATREWINLNLSIRRAIRFKLENEYLTYRVRAGFAAFVAANPSHHGSLESVGTFNTEDVTGQMLELLYEGHNCFFNFHNDPRYLGRQRLFELSTEGISDLFFTQQTTRVVEQSPPQTAD